MSSERLTSRAILRVLDEAAARYHFPMLDNGYVYPADVRLSAYGDSKRWALAVEQLGVFSRDPSFINTVYCYGNCLTSRRTTRDFVTEEAYHAWRAKHLYSEDLTVFPVADGPSAPLLDPYGYLDVNPAARDVRVRDEVVLIPRHPDLYRARGVTLEAPSRLRLYELMRGLLPDVRPGLLARDEEIHQLIPPDLPRLIRLDAWRHPDLANDQRPSRSVTFRHIAAVLEVADPSHYRPACRPNTHWSNWPVGGTL